MVTRLWKYTKMRCIWGGIKNTYLAKYNFFVIHPLGNKKHESENFLTTEKLRLRTPPPVGRKIILIYYNITPSIAAM